jgi:hypothetical protein
MRRLLVILSTLLGARGQCTLPAPDANTVYVQPGGALDCAEGSVIADGESCTIQCNVGFSQGAAGTYVFSCGAGGVPSAPAPQCAACPQTGYNDTPGEAQCEPCPANSQTNAPAGIMVQECLCFAGYFGDINEPADTCTECAENTYNEDPGSARCDDCPDDSSTDGNSGSDEAGDCLCDAGHTGIVTAPDSVCEACQAAEYKGAIGPAPCDDCPANSDSAPASTAVTACECDAGYSGIIEDR